MRKHLPFFYILVSYFIVAGLFAIRVPDWQAPDEPAHYNVVRQIAANGCCPLIEPGDWDQALLDGLKAAKFGMLYGDPNGFHPLPAIQYEDHQPPLYYMLLAPVYSFTGGSLTALRLASVVIGACVVIAAYAVSLRAFPGRYSVAWAAAAFVAFLPQHVHILASVNNDALAFALCGAILWACIDHADGGKTPAWALGLLVGAAFLTKTTAYMMAGVALIALVLRKSDATLATGELHRQNGAKLRAQADDYRPPWYARRYPTLYNVITGTTQSSGAMLYTRFGSLGARIVAFLIPAVALGALWWLRNISVYGFPDFLGLRAHDAVVVGQLRTADYIAQIGASAYIGEAAKTVVTSFYGQFGWMGVPLHSFTLGTVALLGYVALTAGGSALAAVAPARKLAARGTWRIFAVTALLAVAMLVYYNTSFVQFQGRYIYPLLIPLAVTVALGLDYLREKLPILCRFPWLTAAALSLVAVLDVYILLRVIVPSLAP